MTRFLSKVECLVTSKDQLLVPNHWLRSNRYTECSNSHKSQDDILEACISFMEDCANVEIDRLRLRVIATHYYPFKDEAHVISFFVATTTQAHFGHVTNSSIWKIEEELSRRPTLRADVEVYWELLLQGGKELYFSHLEVDEDNTVVEQVVFPLKDIPSYSSRY